MHWAATAVCVQLSSPAVEAPIHAFHMQFAIAPHRTAPLALHWLRDLRPVLIPQDLIREMSGESDCFRARSSRASSRSYLPTCSCLECMLPWQWWVVVC